MPDIATRYRHVAGGFTERVVAVPPEHWDDPAPCEGWVARDVVRHLVAWLPAFFWGQWQLEAPTIPSVDDDPVAAWHTFDEALRVLLDDAELVASERELPKGRMSFGDA